MEKNKDTNNNTQKVLEKMKQYFDKQVEEAIASKNLSRLVLNLQLLNLQSNALEAEADELIMECEEENDTRKIADIIRKLTKIKAIRLELTKEKAIIRSILNADSKRI